MLSFGKLLLVWWADPGFPCHEFTSSMTAVILSDAYWISPTGLPPSYKSVVSPVKYSCILLINPSYWSYVHQIRVSELGTTLFVLVLSSQFLTWSSHLQTRLYPCFSRGISRVDLNPTCRGEWSYFVSRMNGWTTKYPVSNSFHITSIKCI
jgi:hypothetical protein